MFVSQPKLTDSGFLRVSAPENRGKRVAGFQCFGLLPSSLYSIGLGYWFKRFLDHHRFLQHSSGYWILVF
jgi:hypothetical protein